MSNDDERDSAEEAHNRDLLRYPDTDGVPPADPVTVEVRRLQADMEAVRPDEDAGDLSIDWQDDSAVVTATISGYHGAVLGYGATALDALASLRAQLVDVGRLPEGTKR